MKVSTTHSIKTVILELTEAEAVELHDYINDSMDLNQPIVIHNIKNILQSGLGWNEEDDEERKL